MWDIENVALGAFVKDAHGGKFSKLERDFALWAKSTIKDRYLL